MHFESAVILCALYLVTSAWSIGLNSKQLTEIIRLYDNHKMSASEITEDDITQFMKEFFEIQEPEVLFDCDSTGAIAVDLKKLLLTLANKDKIIHDCFKTQMLTSFEVEFFLSVFTKEAKYSYHNGCLGLEQLPGVLKDFKVDKIEIENIVEKLKFKKKTVQFVVHEAEFLLIMLEIKPEGYGLDLQQIVKFINLYNTCPKWTIVPRGIDILEIQKIFIDFGMADSKHYSKMLFKSNRSAAKQLMELMLVTAERGRKRHMDKQGFLDTSIVRFFLDEFVEYDEDSDGFLSAEELSTKLKTMNCCWFSMPDLNNPRNNDEGKTNVANFLKIMFSYYIEEIELAIKRNDKKRASKILY